MKLTKYKIEELISDVSQWLLKHMLMFNGGKTDVLLMHYKYMHLQLFPPLKICNDVVNTSLSAHNLGVLFYECLRVEKTGIWCFTVWFLSSQKYSKI